jgi:hypothetical protein
VNTGTDTWEWECRTCKFLEEFQGANEPHWDLRCPTKDLRESCDGEKYCVYVAFGGHVPREDDDKPLDYIRPGEQVYVTNTEEYRKCKISQDICKSVRTHSEEWLFYTGATVHVTPNKYLLFNTSNCFREIKVANGKYVHTYLVGDVLLRGECGNYLVL